MAAPRSCALWDYYGRRWSRVMRGCWLPRLRSSWPGNPLGARLLSQQNQATKTHFGFETVSEEEKGGKVYQVFESVAKNYDVMNDMMSLGIHRIWKDLLLWKMHPFPGTQLLDVAGGTGDIAFRFLNYVQGQHQIKQKRQLRAQQNLSWEEIAQKYQNEEDSLGGSQVMVCDINKEMLKIGRQKACARGYKTGALPTPRKKQKTEPFAVHLSISFSEGPTGTVEETPVNSTAGLAWILGDAEELPFDDDKFDVYTIAFGIRNVTHIDQALQEAHRVLKPGGRFLCLEFSQVNNPLVSRLYDLYSFQVIPVLGEVIAGDWKSYQYLVESIRQFPSQEEFKEMIEDAGFQKVTYENLTSGIVAIHSGFKL
ncbi:2-methoxy-6-polyprenyl-1,4-benzoquinol methylase, mitochondrial isoform 1-T1 [Molossus nigricans]